MTLIDKAEARNDDLIRRGDANKDALASAAGLYHWTSEAEEELKAAIDAIPAVSIQPLIDAAVAKALEEAAGVKVKPLEWEPSAINKPWHSAKAPWGWYYAQWDDETQAWFASLEMGEVEAPIILSPSDVPSIEAAKAAAQADYEARIRAALIPQSGTDSLRQARVEGMRAAHTVACLCSGTAPNVADAIAALIAREGGE